MEADDAPEICFPTPLQQHTAPSTSTPPPTSRVAPPQQAPLPKRRRQRQRLNEHHQVPHETHAAPGAWLLVPPLASWRQQAEESNIQTLVGQMFGPLRTTRHHQKQQHQQMFLEEPKIASFRWKHEVIANQSNIAAAADGGGGASSRNCGGYSDDELIFETTTKAGRAAHHRRPQRILSDEKQQQRKDSDDNSEDDDEDTGCYCCCSPPSSSQVAKKKSCDVLCVFRRLLQRLRGFKFPTFWFPHCATFRYRVVEMEFAYYHSSHKRVGLTCCGIACLLTIGGVFTVSGDRSGFPDTQDTLNLVAAALWFVCAWLIGFLGLAGTAQEKNCRDLARGDAQQQINNGRCNGRTGSSSKQQQHDVKKLLRRLWILSADPLSPRQPLRFYAQIYEAVAFVVHVTCYIFGAGNYLYECNDSFQGIIDVAGRNATLLCNASSGGGVTTSCSTFLSLPQFSSCAEYVMAYGPQLACRTSSQGAALLLLSTSSIIFFVPLRSIYLVPLHVVGVVVLMLMYPVPDKWLPTGLTVHQFICLAMAWVVQITIALGASIARELRSRATFRLHVERHRRSAQIVYLKHQLDAVAKIQLPEELLAPVVTVMNSPSQMFIPVTPQGTGRGGSLSIAGFAPMSTTQHLNTTTNLVDPLFASFTATEQSRGFSMLLPFVGTATNPLAPGGGSNDATPPGPRRSIEDGDVVVDPTADGAAPISTINYGANFQSAMNHHYHHGGTKTLSPIGIVKHDTHAVLLHMRVLGFAGWGCRSSPSDYVDGVRRLMDSVDRILEDTHRKTHAAADNDNHLNAISRKQRQPPFFLRRVHCFGDDICIVGVPQLSTADAVALTTISGRHNKEGKSPQPLSIVELAAVRTNSSAVGGGGGLSTSTLTRREVDVPTMADNYGARTTTVKHQPAIPSSAAAPLLPLPILLLREAIVQVAHAIVSDVSTCGRSSMEEFVHSLPWTVEEDCDEGSCQSKGGDRTSAIGRPLLSPRSERRTTTSLADARSLRLFPIAVIVEGGAGYKLHPATKNIVAIGPALDRAIALTLERQQRRDQSVLTTPTTDGAGVTTAVGAIDAEGPEDFVNLLQGWQIISPQEKLPEVPPNPPLARDHHFGSFAIPLLRSQCKPALLSASSYQRPPSWPAPPSAASSQRRVPVESYYISCATSIVAATSPTPPFVSRRIVGAGDGDALARSLGESQRSVKRSITIGEDRPNNVLVSQKHPKPPLMMLAAAMVRTSAAGATPGQSTMASNSGGSGGSPTMNPREGRDCFVVTVHPVQPPTSTGALVAHLPGGGGGPVSGTRARRGSVSFAPPVATAMQATMPSHEDEGQVSMDEGPPPLTPLLVTDEHNNGGDIVPLHFAHFYGDEGDFSLSFSGFSAQSPFAPPTTIVDARQRAGRRVRMKLRYLLFHVFEDPATERSYQENCTEVGASALDVMVCALGTCATMVVIFVIAVLDLAAERRSCAIAVDFVRHHPGGSLGAEVPSWGWKEYTNWLWPAVAVVSCTIAVCLHIYSVTHPLPPSPPTTPVAAAAAAVAKDDATTQPTTDVAAVKKPRHPWWAPVIMCLMSPLPKLFFVIAIFCAVPGTVIHDAQTLWIIMGIDFALIRPITATGVFGGIKRDLPLCVPLIVRAMLRHGTEDHGTPLTYTNQNPLTTQAIYMANQYSESNLTGRKSGTAIYLSWASLLIIIAIRILTEIRQREVFATAKLLDFQKEEMESDYKALELALDATVPAGGVAERLVRRMRSSKVFLDDWRRQDDNDDDNADALAAQSSGELSSSSAPGNQHNGGIFSNNNNSFGDNGLATEIPFPPPIPAVFTSAKTAPAGSSFPDPAGGVLMHPLWSASGNAHSDDVPIIVLRWMAPPYHNSKSVDTASLETASSSPLPLSAFGEAAESVAKNSEDEGILTDSFASARDRTHPATPGKRRGVPAGRQSGTVGGSDPWESIFDDITEAIPAHLKSAVQLIQCTRRVAIFAVPEGEESNSAGEGDGTEEADKDADNVRCLKALHAARAIAAYYSTRLAKHNNHHNEESYATTISAAVSNSAATPGGTTSSAKTRSRSDIEDANDFLHQEPEDPFSDFEEVARGGYETGNVGAAEPHTTPKRRATVSVRPQQQQQSSPHTQEQHRPPPQPPRPSTQAAAGAALQSLQSSSSLQTSQLSIWLDFGPAMGALIGRTKGIQFGYYGAPVTSLCAIQEQFSWHSNGAPDWRAFRGMHHVNSSSGESGFIVATQRFVETAQLRDISGEVLDMSPQSHVYGGDVNATVAPQQPTLPHSLCLRVPASATRFIPHAIGGKCGRPPSFCAVPKQRFYCVSSLRTDEEEITSARKKSQSSEPA